MLIIIIIIFIRLGTYRRVAKIFLAGVIIFRLMSEKYYLFLYYTSLSIVVINLYIKHETELNDMTYFVEI